jgi:hypothetical protein
MERKHRINGNFRLPEIDEEARNWERQPYKWYTSMKHEQDDSSDSEAGDSYTESFPTDSRRTGRPQKRYEGKSCEEDDSEKKDFGRLRRYHKKAKSRQTAIGAARDRKISEETRWSDLPDEWYWNDDDWYPSAPGYDVEVEHQRANAIRAALVEEARARQRESDARARYKANVLRNWNYDIEHDHLREIMDVWDEGSRFYSREPHRSWDWGWGYDDEPYVYMGPRVSYLSLPDLILKPPAPIVGAVGEEPIRKKKRPTKDEQVWVKVVREELASDSEEACTGKESRKKDRQIKAHQNHQKERRMMGHGRGHR